MNILGDPYDPCHENVTRGFQSVPCVLGQGHEAPCVASADVEQRRHEMLVAKLNDVISAPHMALGNLTTRGLASQLLDIVTGTVAVESVAGERWANMITERGQWLRHGVMRGQTDEPYGLSEEWSWTQHFAQDVLWRKAKEDFVPIADMDPSYRHNAIKYLLKHAPKYAHVVSRELLQLSPAAASEVAEMAVDPQAWIKQTPLYRKLIEVTPGSDWYAKHEVTMIPLDVATDESFVPEWTLS